MDRRAQSHRFTAMKSEVPRKADDERVDRVSVQANPYVGVHIQNKLE